MDKQVTILTPNGRRQNVKVTPNTTLLQILEEACSKHGFDSDEYVLRHHNKEVGLTQMFRFSGLPNNCLLEMWQTEKKRVESNVDICVQLEDGSRKQGRFVPSDNLWHVVEHLTAEAALTYISPVVIYMRQEIIGKDKISSTTLKSLGITEGRAMIRLLNKNPEDLKIQANVYIAPTVKETPKEGVETTKRSATSTGSGGFAITKELVQSLKKPAASVPGETSDTTAGDDDAARHMDISSEPSIQPAERDKPVYDWGTGSGRTINGVVEVKPIETEPEAEMEIEPEVHVVGERNAIIYSMDATQKQIEDLPDSFFDLTVNDLKLVLRDLKKVASGSEDMPLLTEKLRELEENKTMLNKIAQYKNCVIRIKFPDRYVLQGIFKPVDNITNVMDFVQKFIAQPEAKFCLFTIPPKCVLPLDKTLLELNFVPTAVVHFGLVENDDPLQESKSIDGEQSFIKSEFLQKLTSVEGAFYAANKMRISKSKPTIAESVESNNHTSSTPQYEPRSPGPSTGAIPKRPRNEDFKQAT